MIRTQKQCFLFSDEVQASCLQDASDGREGFEEREFKGQPQEVRRPRRPQQRRQSQQTLFQRFRPKLSLHRQ